MDLQYFGAGCIGITTKNSRIIVDDINKAVGLGKIAKPTDIVAFTNHSEKDGDYRLFIDCPGEYEVGDASIYGIEAKSHTSDGGISTIYKIIINDIAVAVIGNIAPELSDNQLEEIGMVDVLFIPVGGHGLTLDAVSAIKLAREIAPKIVIPVHYADKAIKYPVPQDSLEEVVKVFAMEPHDAGNKLKVKNTDLTDTMQLVTLERT